MTAPVQVGPSPEGGGPVPSPRDYDETVADISDRVRAERRARGWTQERFAALSGMTLVQVKGLERGSAPMRNYLAACAALGVEFSDLVSRDWRLPQRMVLAPWLVAVLAAVSEPGSLRDAALRLGVPREQVASSLSVAYRLLDVAYLPVGERRAAACRVARERGLLPERSLNDAA